MTTKSQQVRENIEDAPHPDNVDGTEGYIAYSARLLMEAGDESEKVADALEGIEQSHSQIAASIDVTDAVESTHPQTAKELHDLALSGSFFIRACRFANAAVNRHPEESE